ncbi:accessory Sec system translocase SecA2 [Lactobacillus agrestimuris]|uniref:accessory Sec system translocase SecA2 n=1 Tax=Lactobacillus agrestimuris TaxID=2941328 RepID=UPI002042CEB3|nr:accessory Sec system translocase SecA2 [Lactobacillus agrestimuris]
MASDSLRLRKPRKLLRKINKLAPQMRKLSDKELKNKTEFLKKQLAQGKTLDDILPEAFAVVREADYRILGLFPYDVQVLGGIILHQGSIAEMKTGEGKTLAATMPLYLNALTGKGAMLVTPNDYLAARDEKELAPVYEWLGLSVSLGFKKEKDTQPIDPSTKRSWYEADIVYTTAASLAFDYLFNNLASTKEKQYLRPFNYVIIDEVDEVLLDEAQTPYVVSSSPTVQSNIYGLADKFVSLLNKKQDYVFHSDEKVYWLTAEGIKKAQTFFGIDNLFATKNRNIYRHIILALGAHLTMNKGHDYLVVKGKVVLLDEETGRLKPGVQVSTGIHQALEAKEHVELTTIQKTAASITFPSLFGLFNKVSGMSGTVKVSEEEFLDIYNLRVVRIPTRLPVIRKDYRPLVFLTTKDKLIEAINAVDEYHEQGRPVLLVAGSVENSEIISELLLNVGIAHNVLNAYNTNYEAQIIKNAGQKGAVTIATNMAGRGTDIKVDEEVKKLGGLAVIGTELLPKRVELQLSGRAGRQGDPGSSEFYISLEDSFVSTHSSERQKRTYRKLIAKKKKNKQVSLLKNPLISLSLSQLRRRVEVQSELIRSQTNKDERILAVQRKNYYELRNHIIKSNNLKNEIETIIDQALELYLDKKNLTDLSELKYFINQHITYDKVEIPDNLKNRTEIKQFLKNLIEQNLTQKKKTLINEEQLNKFYHQVMISAMDNCWIDQVDLIDKLKIEARGWNKTTRPAELLQNEAAFSSYLKFLDKMKVAIFNNLLLSQITINEKGQLVVIFN